MQKYFSCKYLATGSLLAPVTPIAWKKSTAGASLLPNVSNCMQISPQSKNGKPPLAAAACQNISVDKKRHHAREHRGDDRHTERAEEPLFALDAAWNIGL